MIKHNLFAALALVLQLCKKACWDTSSHVDIISVPRLSRGNRMEMYEKKVCLPLASYFN